MLNERPRNDRSPMNLRDVTAAAADRILDTAPEFGPLPDALSDEPPTNLERQLLADAGCNLDNVPFSRWGVTVRALRAGHEAGRVSVLHAPVRVWREGDPPPESKVALLDGYGLVAVWDPAVHRSRDWPAFLAEAGVPLVEIPVDCDAAVAADATRRRAALESTGATVPARTWGNTHVQEPDDPDTTLTVVATAPGDAEVQLCIDGPDDVCLDREQAAELIADLQARFAVIDPAGGTL
jgi:hypothetical protein